MNSDRKKLILKLSSILTLVLICVFCVSIAAVCFHIYKTEGDIPFSRETVGAHAVYFLPQMIIAVTAVIASGVLSLVFREEAARLTAPKDEYKTLKRVRVAALKKASERMLPVSALGERKIRTILGAVFTAIVLVTAVFSLIFALDTSRYSLDDINGDVLKVVLVILPLTVAVAILGYALDKLARRSAEREGAILKSFITGEGSELASYVECPVAIALGKAARVLSRPVVAFTFKGVVLAVAVTFIVVGIVNGGMSDVLGKAVRICTECIGLG
jgi:hypothetical protein